MSVSGGTTPATLTAVRPLVLSARHGCHIGADPDAAACAVGEHPPVRRIMTAVVLGALLMATTAAAERAPPRREAAAISKAVRASSAPRAVKCFSVGHIEISTKGPWARANIVPCHRGDHALLVLQLRAGRWYLRDIGTADVGCTVAPKRVRIDLRLNCQ